VTAPRQRARGALAGLIGVVPVVMTGAQASGADIIANTRTLWADAAFQQGVHSTLPPTAPVCVNHNSQHRYGKFSVSGETGFANTYSLSGAQAIFHEPGAQLSWGTTSRSYKRFVDQQLWYSLPRDLGTGTSFLEVGYLYGSTGQLSDRQGLFFGRTDTLSAHKTREWWFGNMPSTMASSYFWKVKVSRSTNKTQYRVYAYEYSGGLTVKASSLTNVLHGAASPPASGKGSPSASFGTEATCWGPGDWLKHKVHNTGDAHDGNGLSMMVKSRHSGWYAPTPTKDSMKAFTQQSPCHAAWYNSASTKYYKISTGEKAL
jgi:hypothetical protein